MIEVKDLFGSYNWRINFFYCEDIDLKLIVESTNAYKNSRRNIKFGLVDWGFEVRYFCN